ncbi:hypothetical protein TorRG33x02_157310, partial [Trema orientale]
ISPAICGGNSSGPTLGGVLGQLVGSTAGLGGKNAKNSREWPLTSRDDHQRYFFGRLGGSRPELTA